MPLPRTTPTPRDLVEGAKTLPAMDYGKLRANVDAVMDASLEGVWSNSE
jgi:hypothetical protein